MKSEIINQVAELLFMSKDDVLRYSKSVEDLNAYYCWNPKRGGKSLLITNYGEKLVVNSSVNFNELKEEFFNGKRN